MRAGCVIVTTGDRPELLRRAVDGALRQEDVSLDVVVVANGCSVPGLPAGARALQLPDNVGPPAARNAALADVEGDAIFFLDDDASWPAPDLCARALARLDAEPDLGILTFRIVDPEGRPPQRRHVPRLRTGDPERTSEVTTFLEGACAIRRTVFQRAGTYEGSFFFGHEGTDLAWRALDAGFRIRYEGDLVVHHPAEPPTRHVEHHYLTARNRVLLARRRLPGLLAVIYCAVWLALGVARAGSVAGLRDELRGFRDGLRAPAGERRPIRWRTAWRMTRIGRPPVV